MTERSPGGSEIFRHEPRERDFEPTGGDPDLVEAVANHIATHLDEPSVFHEVVSDLVHVDVHCVPPGGGREWITLVTSGMAERPMILPDDPPEEHFAELVLALPSDWPLTQEDFDDEANYWPIRLLKTLARLPHEFETFLWIGHTVPNGDPPEPYAPSTKLCCALVAPAILVPDDFRELDVGEGRIVNFLGVVPLYEDEMDFKLEKGTEALFDLFDEHEVTELVAPDRPSVVPHRRGLFRS